MQASERMQTAILEQVLSDDELENRVRSLASLEDSISMLSMSAARERPCNTFGRSHLRLGPRNCGADHSQTERRGRRHKLHHCQPTVHGSSIKRVLGGPLDWRGMRLRFSERARQQIGGQSEREGA